MTAAAASKSSPHASSSPSSSRGAWGGASAAGGGSIDGEGVATFFAAAPGEGDARGDGAAASAARADRVLMLGTPGWLGHCYKGSEVVRRNGHDDPDLIFRPRGSRAKPRFLGYCSGPWAIVMAQPRSRHY